jgi:DNA-directed RNA polymerase specialized sigma24 family protein
MISDITEFYKTLEKIPSHILEVVLLSRLEGRTDDEIARDNDFAESVLSVTKND